MNYRDVPTNHGGYYRVWRDETGHFCCHMIEEDVEKVIDDYAQIPMQYIAAIRKAVTDLTPLSLPASMDPTRQGFRFDL
jgi:hypothetical protein